GFSLPLCNFFESGFFFFLLLSSSTSNPIENSNIRSGNLKKKQICGASQPDVAMLKETKNGNRSAVPHDLGSGSSITRYY
ncbi:unnamed protein product, partial [Brassica rapa subsp. trilocularis]